MKLIFINKPLNSTIEEGVYIPIKEIIKLSFETKHYEETKRGDNFWGIESIEFKSKTTYYIETAHYKYVVDKEQFEKIVAALDE